ncbi:hypothetical protein QJS66_22740 [Kocuria rhizophila]|nr:hypothetical protein QJS66_22740 [Kocuria rhizophila]
MSSRWRRAGDQHRLPGPAPQRRGVRSSLLRTRSLPGGAADALGAPPGEGPPDLSRRGAGGRGAGGDRRLVPRPPGARRPRGRDRGVGDASPGAPDRPHAAVGTPPCADAALLAGAVLADGTPQRPAPGDHRARARGAPGRGRVRRVVRSSNLRWDGH